MSCFSDPIRTRISFGLSGKQQARHKSDVKIELEAHASARASRRVLTRGGSVFIVIGVVDMRPVLQIPTAKDTKAAKLPKEKA
jgi:hypothetical protein